MIAATARNRALVKLNAVPSRPSLSESDLFRTMKGAFNCPWTAIGRFELADGGTLFLDEVQRCCLSKRRVAAARAADGSLSRRKHKTFQVNVRIMRPQTVSLGKACWSAAVFLSDLFYRLKPFFSARASPLRDRRSEFHTCHFFYTGSANNLAGKSTPREGNNGCIDAYPWPGISRTSRILSSERSYFQQGLLCRWTARFSSQKPRLGRSSPHTLRRHQRLIPTPGNRARSAETSCPP